MKRQLLNAAVCGACLLPLVGCTNNESAAGEWSELLRMLVEAWSDQLWMFVTQFARNALAAVLL